jgi:hypothetical protein
MLFTKSVLLKLGKLKLAWVRVKTTLRVGFLLKTEIEFRNNYGDWYKLHAVGKRLYPSLEDFGNEYGWWAEEWPEFIDHCKRTAPHKPLPIEVVVYRNLKNFKNGLWSEPFVV